jgi:multicomponent K+:H+ antiporter subunit D
MVTGMPPLAGFLAKLLLLQAAVATADPNAWLLMAAILLSGFGGLIALARMGVRLFWTVSARATPRLRLIEAGPVAFLMLVSVGLTIWAGPAAGLAESAARLLADPSTYIGAVLGAAEAPR